MPDDNKENLVYFENPSMRGLFDDMKAWQTENRKRLLSVSIQRDGEAFCCVALTNPTEVIICDGGGGPGPARVHDFGSIDVYT